jgi:hypothetical protein
MVAAFAASSPELMIVIKLVRWRPEISLGDAVNVALPLLIAPDLARRSEKMSMQSLRTILSQALAVKRDCQY